MLFDIAGFEYETVCEGAVTDTEFWTSTDGETLSAFLRAGKDRPMFVKLKWAFGCDGDMLVLGDAWERSYGDLRFRRPGGDGDAMPWYFTVRSGEKNFCFGVKTGCSSFVSFRLGEDGIAALIDVRNGSRGVRLDGREVCLATFVYKEYDSPDSFACLRDFCRRLCDKPMLPDIPVIGGNNWYYAYGNSSFDEIVSDAKLQAELAAGTGLTPFEVVDDGWEIGSTEGPWLPNERFGDMARLASEIEKAGAIPGIWYRPLANEREDITPDMRIAREGERRLDPTHPAVKELIKEDIKRMRAWGYRLLKHDFSTYDIFGSWGKDMGDTVIGDGDLTFYNDGRTNAEIVLDLYRLIREACGDMLIIGCNTVSHLCAGLVEINRTGDDTSGREFSRTVKMGVNTLAFRLAQNGAFYLADADCVGIMGGQDENIPWRLNKRWLDLLSVSGTALFVSCNRASATDEIRRDLHEAYKRYSRPHTLVPLDIYETPTPRRWSVDGTETVFDWEQNGK
ncbi:MAG: hypothetical protein IJM45_11160 [Clostridia bacterium]|nr:hypothetical protein [Clostridia bacterium]